LITRFLNNLSIIETQLLSFALKDLESAKEARGNLFALIKVTSKFDEYLSQINDVTFQPTNAIYNTGHHAYDDHFNEAKRKLLSVIVSIKREVNFGALESIPLAKPETISIPWFWDNISIGALWKIGGILFLTHAFTFGLGIWFN
tara:strand:- start:67 stop:501 length:435 start_codon:yes stop_codon:yes gene_type:complete